MEPVIAITTALTSLKTTIDFLKLIKDTDFSLEKAEIKLKIADLATALADAQNRITEIQELLIEKDAKIKELKERLSLKGKVKYESPFYWLYDKETKDGPFCPQCRDSTGKLIRLHDNRNGVWSCKTCRNVYDSSTKQISLKPRINEY